MTPTQDAFARVASERRRSPRALVCASVVVATENRPPSEHFTHDLSISGVRLCGTPTAAIGNRVAILFTLPSGTLKLVGRVVWVNAPSGFALEFVSPPASAQDAIHDAVTQALLHPERRSLLLLHDARERVGGAGAGAAPALEPEPEPFEPLQPIMPISVRVTTPLDAVRQLEDQPIRFGVVSPAGSSLGRGFAEAFPKVRWRELADFGRLRRVGHNGR